MFIKIKIIAIISIIILSLYSCTKTKDLDGRVEEYYNNNNNKDSLVDLSTLFPEKWDTVYFITNACPYMEILDRIGPTYSGLWQDVGDKILIIDSQEKKVVYYKEWDPNYDQLKKGVVFEFQENKNIIAIPRKQAKFTLKARKGLFYLIYKN